MNMNELYFIFIGICVVIVSTIVRFSRLNNKDKNNNGVIIFGSILLLFLTLALLSTLPK